MASLEKAIGKCQLIVAKFPPTSEITPEAHFMAALCYQKLGESEKATDHLKQVVVKWPECKYSWHAKFMIDHRATEVQKWEPNSK
jgi:TolA-binding protein